MGNDELINQDSGCVEYYTPPEILAYVHRMFPVIELDPASCETANQNVKALRFFNKENDALKQQWHAKTVWMNHPSAKEKRLAARNVKRRSATTQRTKSIVATASIVTFHQMVIGLIITLVNLTLETSKRP